MWCNSNTYAKLYTDVLYTEDENWEPESDPETETTRHRLDTRWVRTYLWYIFVKIYFSTKIIPLQWWPIIEYVLRNGISAYLSCHYHRSIYKTHQNHEITHQNTGYAPVWWIKMNIQTDLFLLIWFEYKLIRQIPCCGIITIMCPSKAQNEPFKLNLKNWQ